METVVFEKFLEEFVPTFLWTADKNGNQQKYCPSDTQFSDYMTIVKNINPTIILFDNSSYEGFREYCIFCCLEKNFKDKNKNKNKYNTDYFGCKHLDYGETDAWISFNNITPEMNITIDFKAV